MASSALPLRSNRDRRSEEPLNKGVLKLGGCLDSDSKRKCPQPRYLCTHLQTPTWARQTHFKVAAP